MGEIVWKELERGHLHCLLPSITYRRTIENYRDRQTSLFWDSYEKIKPTTVVILTIKKTASTLWHSVPRRMRSYDRSIHYNNLHDHGVFTPENKGQFEIWTKRIPRLL
jgi:hypothetical protein